MQLPAVPAPPGFPMTDDEITAHNKKHLRADVFERVEGYRAWSRRAEEAGPRIALHIAVVMDEARLALWLEVGRRSLSEQELADLAEQERAIDWIAARTSNTR